MPISYGEFPVTEFGSGFVVKKAYGTARVAEQAMRSRDSAWSDNPGDKGCQAMRLGVGLVFFGVLWVGIRAMGS